MQGNHDNVDIVYDCLYYIDGCGIKRIGNIKFFCLNKLETYTIEA